MQSTQDPKGIRFHCMVRYGWFCMVLTQSREVGRSRGAILDAQLRSSDFFIYYPLLTWVASAGSTAAYLCSKTVVGIRPRPGGSLFSCHCK
jgi:hypothetical protein